MSLESTEIDENYFMLSIFCMYQVKEQDRTAKKKNGYMIRFSYWALAERLYKHEKRTENVV